MVNDVDVDTVVIAADVTVVMYDTGRVSVVVVV